MPTFWRVVRFGILAAVGAPLLVLLCAVTIPTLVLEWIVSPLDLWLLRMAGDDAGSVLMDRRERPAEWQDKTAHLSTWTDALPAAAGVRRGGDDCEQK